MFILTDKKRLFILSFLSLFLELALIRYIPANVRLVGFFSNLILLATFAGLGVGFLLAKRKFNLLYLSPIILLLLIVLAKIIRVEVNIVSSEIIFFKAIYDQGVPVEPYYILPIIFLLTALIFIPLGQAMGQLFVKFKPLIAYALDILGSLTGIVVFSVLAFFSIPAWIWFVIISFLFLIILIKRGHPRTYLFAPLLCLIVVAVWFFNRGSYWSPYYKITISQFGEVYNLSTNDIGHQYISRAEIREPFYFTPYELFKKPVYRKILIIGAGTGGDAGVVLTSDPLVEKIDAVEIDPVIATLGVKLNQDRVYQNPRVKLHITDGRQFLHTTNEKYDLILFALTDSLTLANTSSNGIRLESFLYTTDSFNDVKTHLADNGLLVVYNYYREAWLVNKLANMLKSVFGSEVYLVRNYVPGLPATILAGPKTQELSMAETGSTTANISSTNLPLANDNWPFLYLRNKAIPSYYFTFLAAIAGISLGLYLLTRIKQKAGFDWRLFFFGAGFLLLETKSLTTFSLLFGTTWLVNSLVFAGILLFVLIANLISVKVVIKNKFLLYLGLFIFLSANYLVPIKVFLSLSPIPRYLLTTIFYFSPIFIANLLFSQTFRNRPESDVSFGSNLLGAVFGGLFEYTSLIWGNASLILFTALFYTLSLVKFRK